MACIFDAIPFDLVESIVVFTLDVYLYYKFIKLYDKFNNFDVQQRVLRKLSIKYADNETLKFVIGPTVEIIDGYHRYCVTYDRPYAININNIWFGEGRMMWDFESEYGYESFYSDITCKRRNSPIDVSTYVRVFRKDVSYFT